MYEGKISRAIFPRSARSESSRVRWAVQRRSFGRKRWSLTCGIVAPCTWNPAEKAAGWRWRCARASSTRRRCARREWLPASAARSTRYQRRKITGKRFFFPPAIVGVSIVQRGCGQKSAYVRVCEIMVNVQWLNISARCNSWTVATPSPLNELFFCVFSSTTAATIGGSTPVFITAFRSLRRVALLYLFLFSKLYSSS